MSEANHSKQGLIRIMGLASAALMSLALSASASSKLNDDAGKSIWGGQIQQCGGKTATSRGLLGCDYSKPAAQGGCPTDTYQASGSGSECVSSSTTCQTCTGSYIPTCGGATL